MAALSVLSAGFYVPIWFGLTWVELRRETSDTRMRPVAHAVSILVPVYGYWQVYRHFVAIGALLARVAGAVKVDPLAATIGVIVWTMTFLHYSPEPLFATLDVIELVAGTAVVIYGQRAINEYWRARPGPPVPQRVLETDWLALALALAAPYVIGAAVTYFTTGTN